jgi:hypothetical protein
MHGQRMPAPQLLLNLVLPQVGEEPLCEEKEVVGQRDRVAA